MNDMENQGRMPFAPTEGVVEAGADSGAGLRGDVGMLVDRASQRGEMIRRALIRRRIEAKRSRELAKKKICEEVLPQWQESKAQTDRKEVIH